MKCPNCGDPTEALYSRGPHNGNTDTTDYCKACNPELVKEIDEDLLDFECKAVATNMVKFYQEYICKGQGKQ